MQRLLPAMHLLMTPSPDHHFSQWPYLHSSRHPSIPSSLHHSITPPSLYYSFIILPLLHQHSSITSSLLCLSITPPSLYLKRHMRENIWTMTSSLVSVRAWTGPVHLVDRKVEGLGVVGRCPCLGLPAQLLQFPAGCFYSSINPEVRPSPPLNHGVTLSTNRLPAAAEKEENLFFRHYLSAKQEPETASAALHQRLLKRLLIGSDPTGDIVWSAEHKSPWSIRAKHTYRGCRGIQIQSCLFFSVYFVSIYFNSGHTCCLLPWLYVELRFLQSFLEQHLTW